MGTNNVFTYTVDALTGLPTQDTTATASAGTGPVFLAMTPAGDFLYVGNQGSKNISGFTRDATTGKLTAVTDSPFSTGSAPSSMFITP
jgi:6-phosphogluconolactonase (cycloisomerase 2 family)